MLRIVIIFNFLINSLYASQLLLVLSNEQNSTTATLQRYEAKSNIYTKVGSAFDVNLGRSGMRVKKIEGDGASPEGIFELGKIFAYQKLATKMPFIQASYDLICVDDTTSKYYNKLLPISKVEGTKSFEFMRRQDELYKYGVVIKHNPNNKVPLGSCVFLHIEKEKNSSTSGCTSMSEQDLLTLIKWLDSTKSPRIIQTTKNDCQEFTKEFKGLSCY